MYLTNPEYIYVHSRSIVNPVLMKWDIPLDEYIRRHPRSVCRLMSIMYSMRVLSLDCAPRWRARRDPRHNEYIYMRVHVVEVIHICMRVHVDEIICACAASWLKLGEVGEVGEVGELGRN